MLTERQQEVLMAIKAFISEHHYAPSTREIATIMGISQNATHLLLTRMRKAGAVDWVNGQSRTLHVTGDDHGQR